MNRTILTAAALLACAAFTALPAKADTFNLVITPLADDQVVPQSASDPCIICATTQAHNPVGFGYNNFDSTGNDSSFNLFSSNITGSFANGDDLTVTPYTSGQLRTFLQGLGDAGLTFGVAVDVNSTGAKSEVLTTFRLLDLDQMGDGPLGSLVVFSLASTAIPDIRNGNGSADYLITGFDLSGIQAGDRLLFQASWDHAVDGGESFYIVPQLAAVPGPIVGAGIPGLVAACTGLFGLNFWRRRRNGATLPV
jgi:hypothetical protein